MKCYVIMSEKLSLHIFLDYKKNKFTFFQCPIHDRQSCLSSSTKNHNFFNDFRHGFELATANYVLCARLLPGRNSVWLRKLYASYQESEILDVLSRMLTRQLSVQSSVFKLWRARVVVSYVTCRQ